MTESLVDAGCRVTLVEMRPQLLRGLDWEMAEHVRKEFERRGVRVALNSRVTGFEGQDQVERVVTERGSWPADLVIMGVGVRPNSELAIRAGLDVCPNGGICVDAHMRTSDPHIYAAGDCVESRNVVTGCSTYAPYGGVANRQGRVAADSICAVESEFPGVLDTAICKTFTLTVGRTGLTEQEARELGYEVVTAHVPALDRAHFMPRAGLVMTKLVVDRSDRRLLGMQAIGPGEVSKRLDVAVTAIAAGMSIDDVANLDLGYAPAYSTAMDCIHTACNVVRNKLSGHMPGIGPRELHTMMEQEEEFCLLDVRTHGERGERKLQGAVHIPLPALRARLGELPEEGRIVIYSWASMSAYEASIILRDHGLEDVFVLDGGLAMWPYDCART
jgi:pyruvate/2-oxoglutarate dehydrogenase complex dihydrolipoamide dehydrogenase (E3) component/rhodanese-related sulfurtransferase